MDQIDRIMQLTMGIGRVMRHRMGSLAREMKINFLQLHALTLIVERPGITMKELAAELFVTGPSATSFIERLVRLRFIRRVRDKRNRKLVRLMITLTGKRKLSACMQRRREVLAAILGKLPQRDLDAMIRLFTDLNALLSTRRHV